MFIVLSPALAVAFIAVQLGRFGLHMRCAFAPNHKGMPSHRRDEELDFLRRQELTTLHARATCGSEAEVGDLDTRSRL